MKLKHYLSTLSVAVVSLPIMAHAEAKEYYIQNYAKQAIIVTYETTYGNQPITTPPIAPNSAFGITVNQKDDEVIYVDVLDVKTVDGKWTADSTCSTERKFLNIQESLLPSNLMCWGAS